MKSSRIYSAFMAALALVVWSDLAHAGREDRRQVRQRVRIQQGVKSGELTRQEAKKLRSEERHVRRMEHRAERDGKITDQEAQRIESAQDKVSQDIYKEKHDDEKRGN